MVEYTIGNQYRHLDYIYAEGRVVALHVKNGNADSLYYILTDHLGSWNKVMRQNKTIVQQTHFDPWGNRMEYSSWNTPQTQVSFSFHRGFTGHEHYDRFKVVNANARLYDPVIGRFFSPDPFVQAPDFTQNFNRYSYCMNNPVMYSDPDGEFWHIIAGAIIGGVVNWFANGAEFTWQGLAYFGIGAAAGALGAGVGAGIASVYAGSSFSAGFCGSVIAMPSSLGVIGGFSSGFAGGFVNGFSSGLGNGLMQTKSFTKSLGFAFDNGIKQGVSGGVVGGLIGGYSAYMKGNHPLTGQKPYLDISLKNYQNVLQNNPSNCKNATLESIEKMNGGTRTQDDFKKLGDAYLETHPQAHLEEYFENLGFNVEDPSTMPVGTIEDAFRNNYPIVVEDATTFGGHTMTLVRIRQWTSNSPKWIWFADPSKKGLSKFLFDYLFETNGLYIFKL